MLRVGILLPGSDAGEEQSAWLALLLERLQQSTNLLPLVFLVSHATPQQRALSLRERVSRRAFAAYREWDARRADAATHALAKVSVASLKPHLETLTLPEEQAGWLGVFSGVGVDVVLCLDPTLLPKGPLGARYGVWLLDVAETLSEPHTPPLWREHSSGAVVVTRLLRMQPAGHAPLVVSETATAVDPFSFAQTCSPVYWKAVEIVVRSLHRLASEGSAMLDGLPHVAPPPQKATSLAMSRFLGREVLRRIRARMPWSRRARFAKWCIGVRPRTEQHHRFDNVDGYRLMIAPRDRFYADPFLFEHAGRTWLFFEDFRYPENRAVISCCALSEDGVPEAPFEVLRLPHHLSYPFVFEDSGQIYMIPESRGNRTVSLYRATNFPHTWELDTHLFTGVDMVDTTLWREGNRWWLFAGVSNGRYSNSDELGIWYADALRGPWTAHPQNPVVSDVRRARPAGRLFRDGERLIRPSQDCGPAYGYGLVFSEVEELSPERYRERVLVELTPEVIPGSTANHTYTRTGRFEVTDRFFIESRLGEAASFAPGRPGER